MTRASKLQKTTLTFGIISSDSREKATCTTELNRNVSPQSSDRIHIYSGRQLNGELRESDHNNLRLRCSFLKIIIVKKVLPLKYKFRSVCSS